MTAQQVARLITSSSSDARVSAQLVTASFPRLIVRDRAGCAVAITDDVAWAHAVRLNVGGDIVDRWNWR